MIEKRYIVGRHDNINGVGINSSGDDSRTIIIIVMPVLSIIFRIVLIIIAVNSNKYCCHG